MCVCDSLSDGDGESRRSPVPFLRFSALVRVLVFIQLIGFSDNEKSDEKRTGGIALHEAASLGDIAKVKELVAKGDGVSAADKKWRTPLHFAAAYGYRTVAELLLSHGSDPAAQDLYGRYPCDAAYERGHTELGSLLEDALHVARGTKREAPSDSLLETEQAAHTPPEPSQSPVFTNHEPNVAVKGSGIMLRDSRTFWKEQCGASLGLPQSCRLCDSAEAGEATASKLRYQTWSELSAEQRSTLLKASAAGQACDMMLTGCQGLLCNSYAPSCRPSSVCLTEQLVTLDALGGDVDAARQRLQELAAVYASSGVAAKIVAMFSTGVQTNRSLWRIEEKILEADIFSTRLQDIDAAIAAGRLHPAKEQLVASLDLVYLRSMLGMLLRNLDSMRAHAELLERRSSTWTQAGLYLGIAICMLCVQLYQVAALYAVASLVWLTSFGWAFPSRQGDWLLAWIPWIRDFVQWWVAYFTVENLRYSSPNVLSKGSTLWDKSVSHVIVVVPFLVCRWLAITPKLAVACYPCFFLLRWSGRWLASFDDAVARLRTAAGSSACARSGLPPTEKQQQQQSLQQSSPVPLSQRHHASERHRHHQQQHQQPQQQQQAATHRYFTCPCCGQKRRTRHSEADAEDLFLELLDNVAAIEHEPTVKLKPLAATVAGPAAESEEERIQRERREREEERRREEDELHRRRLEKEERRREQQAVEEANRLRREQRRREQQERQAADAERRQQQDEQRRRKLDDEKRARDKAAEEDRRRAEAERKAREEESERLRVQREEERRRLQEADRKRAEEERLKREIEEMQVQLEAEAKCQELLRSKKEANERKQREEEEARKKAREEEEARKKAQHDLRQRKQESERKRREAEDRAKAKHEERRKRELEQRNRAFQKLEEVKKKEEKTIKERSLLSSSLDIKVAAADTDGLAPRLSVSAEVGLGYRAEQQGPVARLPPAATTTSEDGSAASRLTDASFLPPSDDQALPYYAAAPTVSSLPPSPLRQPPVHGRAHPHDGQQQHQQQQSAAVSNGSAGGNSFDRLRRTDGTLTITEFVPSSLKHQHQQQPTERTMSRLYSHQDMDTGSWNFNGTMPLNAAQTFSLRGSAEWSVALSSVFEGDTMEPHNQHQQSHMLGRSVTGFGHFGPGVGDHDPAEIHSGGSSLPSLSDRTSPALFSSASPDDNVYYLPDDLQDEDEIEIADLLGPIADDIVGFSSRAKKELSKTFGAMPLYT